MSPMHGNKLVWAMTADGYERMRLAVAQKQDLWIVRCAMCDRYAVVLDSLAPYHQENNRCREHVGKSRSEPLTRLAAAERRAQVAERALELASDDMAEWVFISESRQYVFDPRSLKTPNPKLWFWRGTPDWLNLAYAIAEAEQEGAQ